ncbi:MAG TPA: M20/M25/M40 family metallo-hydrolase [Vicinamibacterales bacterium]|nr:M20/M25/M40 family metallo-hydrolase [Vicinamibacterales bacterium]
MTNATYARVNAAIERLTPRYVSLLQELVRIPSQTGQEAAAQAVVARQMREIGLAVETFDVDLAALAVHPAFNRTPRSYDGRPNVAGRLHGTGAGKSLLLNAHIDTVPVERADTWTREPFGAEIVDGRLYGRGACDDKAGIVESLLVAHALRDAGVNLVGDLSIVSVIEDETSGNGTLASVERGYTADGVVIVDGTWPERFIVSHLGQVTFQIRIPGLAGHATSAGPNPIASVGDVFDRVRAMVERKNTNCAAPWGDKAAPYFVNFGRIYGGVFPGSVPAECVIEGQYGFPPPDTRERAKAELQEAVGPIAITFDGLETEPHVGDPGNELVRLLTTTVERRDGAVLKESIISGHADLRHYVNARTGATRAVCLYGPGGGRNVHGADEYFELAHLPLVAFNLASLAIDWCGAASDR